MLPLPANMCIGAANSSSQGQARDILVRLGLSLWRRLGALAELLHANRGIHGLRLAQ